MPPSAHRYPRLRYFALGVSVVALCSRLLIYRSDIINTRPLVTAVEYLPWALFVALVAMRWRKGPAVRPLSYAAGAASYYVAMVAWLFWGSAIADRWHRRSFDPTAWRQKDRGDAMWPARLTMVDDLLARHQLRGLSRDSVERLLGPRDDTPCWRDWDLVYWLGPERGLIRIDSEWLVLRLGANGRVSEYRIVRD